MRVSLDTTSFQNKMQKFTEYSIGFLDGAQIGKKIFFDNLGKGIVFTLGKYIDVEARSNRLALHHVYEWYQTGSPSARLFDLKYTSTSIGLSLSATFRQSSSVSKDATKPFYNKAKIMEEGIPVTITPSPGKTLRFIDNGEEVFTKKSITINNPGGNAVQGSFEKVFDEFMKRYFTQAFLRASGISDHIKNPRIYKQNLASGVRQGRSVGIATGFKWMASAKIEVE